jgi:hypothetical protein
MATYDFEGMFGDRYSTDQAINNAMFSEAMSFGQLDRTKYAPMTASSYGQAYMGSANLAGMLGGQHPMRKRQNLLDEIQKKFPDPRTPDELNALAAELSTNGFGDLAMQIRQVAMEMEKNEATKAYQTSQVNKPTESWLKKIPETLKGSIMTTALENEYLRVSGKADLINYDKDEYDSVGVWRDFRKAQLEDIDNLIQQFADSLHIPGITKQDIQAAIGDDAALTEKFIAWIGTSGNRDVANNLLTAMGRLDTEASVANNLPHTQEKVDVSKKDFPMTYKMNEKSAENMKIYLEGLIQKGGNLDAHQLKQLEELKRRFPMGDTASANIPPTVDAWWGYG